ncbi:DEAD/DEAH box helicase family protein [Gracilibacillus sp. JCM 18860]|uniref:DEAD/DEAH box helicase family protein n=1 Tax=Gracilibacillus sp. JCM 18860 TaxID=1306159 RepID=UPI0006D18FBB
MEQGAEEPELDDLEEEEIYIEDQSKYESINRLFQQNFQTLILDESHHLRTSWWKTTIHLRDQLENPAIVALTATLLMMWERQNGKTT